MPRQHNRRQQNQPHLRRLRMNQEMCLHHGWQKARFKIWIDSLAKEVREVQETGPAQKISLDQCQPAIAAPEFSLIHRVMILDRGEIMLSPLSEETGLCQLLRNLA